MACPYLREIVMLHCEACPFHKALPLDKLASASPCLALEFRDCPIYQDAVAQAHHMARGGTPPGAQKERRVS
jgi:hypothetical protein